MHCQVIKYIMIQRDLPVPRFSVGILLLFSIMNMMFLLCFINLLIFLLKSVNNTERSIVLKNIFHHHQFVFKLTIFTLIDC